MASIASFVFNPFQENTYVVYDETKECVIVDPGCSNPSEQQELSDFITDKGLKPVRHLLTHAHIDHVLGCDYIYRTYGLLPELHQTEMPVLQSAEAVGQAYGIPIAPPPVPQQYLKEGELLKFGNTEFDMRFTPGHSPGSISFINTKDKFMLSGDVLFQMSIGRTDLPGGNYDTLISSIKSQLLPLPDDYAVYSGHGPATTIGFERQHNPFLT